jgi:type III restriction enzyme
MLDTLEVLAHDKYEDLLKRRNVFSEQFIDHKIRAMLRTDSQGNTVVVRETETVENPVIPAPEPPTERTPDPGATSLADGSHQGDASSVDVASDTSGTPTLASIEARKTSGQQQSHQLATQVAPLHPVQLPLLKPVAVVSHFSLTDITDHEQFRQLGRRLHASPEDTLRRTVVAAEVYTDPFLGVKSTRLRTSEAVDRVEASGLIMTMPELRSQLTEAVLGLGIIAARRDDQGIERRAIEPILDAFIDGLNGGADTLLSAYLDRATALLLDAINREYRRFSSKPVFEETVSVKSIDRARPNTRPITPNRHGAFSKGTAYEGWKRSVYAVNWFDSAPERDLAILLDESDRIAEWCRLLNDDLAIVWASSGQRYNADFVVVTTDGTRWVVEAKADNQVTSDEVTAKREAAKRWVNKVNASGIMSDTWAYLLVTETDIRSARGSWGALAKLGR